MVEIVVHLPTERKVSSIGILIHIDEGVMAIQYHMDSFPPKNIDWVELVPLLSKATAAVARYDGLLNAIPNPSVLLSPLMANEAVLSSRI